MNVLSAVNFVFPEIVLHLRPIVCLFGDRR